MNNFEKPFQNQMENESKQESKKAMICASTEKSIVELEEEGWKYDWSFNYTNNKHWNDACDRVADLKKDGFWEPVLVLGQDEVERRAGVEYIYKRKTDKQKQYDKDMGYSN